MFSIRDTSWRKVPDGLVIYQGWATVVQRGEDRIALASHSAALAADLAGDGTSPAVYEREVNDVGNYALSVPHILKGTDRSSGACPAES